MKTASNPNIKVLAGHIHSFPAPLLIAAISFSLIHPVSACIWDGESLSSEKRKSPELAALVLNPTPPPSDPAPYLKKITQLRIAPRESDPTWWNDLAGAHIRAGKYQEAVCLLEPLLNRFPNDYGIHANLGTAYHLLGRFADAEREIARDLEINPDAHFGLERYHLALLQYLVRDKAYQRRHLYVDEFTWSFLNFHYRPYSNESFRTNRGNMFSDSDQRMAEEGLARTNTSTRDVGAFLSVLADDDAIPSYREKWNLADNPKLEEGVRYLASLNPTEPACLTMVGVVCAKIGRYHLSAIAFDRAAGMNSVQADLLRQYAVTMREHVARSSRINGMFLFNVPPEVATVFALLGIYTLVFFRIRRQRAART